MQKQAIFIFIAVVFLFGTIIFFVYASSASKLSPSASNLEECKNLYFNSESGLNLVFFADKETTKKYADFFLNTEPFKEDKEKYNFYYIESFSPECEFYNNIALLCRSKEMITKASSCPVDYIVAIKPENSNIRSSSFLNILSINSNHPLSVLTHEFGHAFANLAEEYTPAKLPKNIKNCVSSCDKFPENKDGCFQGCSDSSYYRSIESGVMRTLNSNNYGKYNKQIILSLLSEFSSKKSSLTGKAVSDSSNCIEREYYLIEGSLQNNQISISQRSIESGCIGSNGYGNFNYTLILSDNTRLTEDSFNPELIFTDTQSESQEEIEGQVEKNQGNFYLKIPIVANSRTLEIFNEDQKTLVNLNDMGARACRI